MPMLFINYFTEKFLYPNGKKHLMIVVKASFI